jgi:hypothetical protein
MEWERTRGDRRVTVYSFGPNRRRDVGEAAAADDRADDVRVTLMKGEGRP